MRLISSNNNIVLRPLKEEDASAMAELANNKKIWDNIRDKMPHPYSVDDAQFFINLTKKENPRLTFAIEMDGKFCGVIGLISLSDVYRLSAEMGYWIGEPFWGRGIASEAVGLIVEYGFERLTLVRIFSGVYEFNIASMRVLEKNGFRKEGIARKAVIKNGKMWDEHKYGRLKSD